jgi:hypothetical protein
LFGFVPKVREFLSGSFIWRRRKQANAITHPDLSE